mgnify:CR=1 FL=1
MTGFPKACSMNTSVGRFVYAVMGLAMVVSWGAAGERDAEQAVAALFVEHWEVSMREDPLAATAAGDHRFGDRFRIFFKPSAKATAQDEDRNL